MMNDYYTMPNGLAFVKTTLKVLKQYEHVSQNFEEQDRFETTLQVNCLLGLLIVPEQHFVGQPNIIIDPENDEAEWGIKLSNVKYCCRQKSCKKRNMNTANEIARHLRNSLVHHNRFEIVSEFNDKITHIIFKDFSKGDVPSFEYKFSIDNLAKFVKRYYLTIFPELTPDDTQQA